ncbi:hypothetical protein RHMOL_Rhmol10G0204400 [Rhododendron molle]|uniref:Uncharacterized protein n=1 Tax=Rhododendron molle TaxID=49168 RepID=A0ACC0M4D7_RHOML|nr:hypothetical protein RHMOL_Rhmol10G0204400 [Rhododendron molle]
MDGSSLIDCWTDRSSLIENWTDGSSLIMNWTDGSSMIDNTQACPDPTQACSRFIYRRGCSETAYSSFKTLPPPPLSSLSNPSHLIDSTSKMNKTSQPKTAMADHDGESGGGDVIDHPEDWGGPMEVEAVDQTAAEAVEVEGALAAGHSSNDQGRE